MRTRLSRRDSGFVQSPFSSRRMMMRRMVAASITWIASAPPPHSPSVSSITSHSPTWASHQGALVRAIQKMASRISR
jgi:hypothetical protein